MNNGEKKSGGLAVLKPGLLTTVQDLGREGYQQFGLGTSGAMDSYALQVANVLVGNWRDEAALELTAAGPTLRAEEDMVVAFTGANMLPSINGEPVSMWKSYAVFKGDDIRFGSAVNGVRAYMSVRGGVDVPVVMGSKSTAVRANIGGFNGRGLKKNDRLPIGKSEGALTVHTGRKVLSEHIPDYGKSVCVRVVMGPQQEAFEEEALELFLNTDYRVTPESDRMGYRLKGAKPLCHRPSVGADIYSDAIAPGAIQVPGDGQPIILLADRQTTGGYTKIATVISVDLWKVAQLPPGGTISFEAVDVKSAQKLWREQEDILVQLSSYGPR
ncbi:biotin-dependent carboxyltransferase family protein [Alteribacter aurantiacus]|uniref:5-oxoprolinase subunit C family protein n=1 Tax=Alteribacter aurantiacus TaxID=254410 RepID=UPI0004207942|nr:biotin-dependent carboxyltransferase family protein [Alteribacter aurantiacus]